MLPEIVGMGVPVLTLLAKIIHIDERNARLDQSPCEQQILTSQIAARGESRRHITRLSSGRSQTVAFTSRGAFLRNIQCGVQRGGIQELNRTTAVFVEPDSLRIGNSGVDDIKSVQQFPSMLHAIW